jgi:glycosyltransferase involved in cell wall biosynthesis
MEKGSSMCLPSPEINDRQRPVVSIGMPTYNDEKYVRSAVDDLLAQTFGDFELVISDNASTDKTEEICRDYAAKDRRVRYYRQTANIGPQNNFLFVLSQARGEFFMWAASDDRWDKDFVRVLLAALRGDESCVSAFCPFMYVDEDGHSLGSAKEFDFSGRHALSRILKFNMVNDDGKDAFFYGLHRRSLIGNPRFPVWWWINAGVPMNCAYPILTFFLARGGYVHAGTKPLWFNRLHIHSKPRYSSGFSDRRIHAYLAFLLRKVNVFCECTRSVYRGTGSASAVLAAVPVLATRCTCDCIWHSISLGAVAVRYVRQRCRKTASSR